MNLIMLGAPGAGKGTQAEVLAKKFGIPTVSTGNILRGAIKDGTKLGLDAKKFMDEGKLVPDGVVIGIIKEYLSSEKCEKGFILDGFPRSIPQAEALEAMGVRIDAVVNLEVPDEAIVRRMSGRRVCDKCGATYHIKNNPSKDNKNCDKCGTPLSIRKDDSPETVTSRLRTYHEQTEPLIEFYKSKGLLLSIDGQGNVDDITTGITAAIQKLKDN